MPFTLIADAPLCANDTVQKEFSIAKYEQARVVCNVFANPHRVKFEWKFNTTAELVDVPLDRYIYKIDHRILVS